MATSTPSDVTLVFRPSTALADLEPTDALENIRKQFEVKLSDLERWFEQFKIDTIELWIEGGISTGGLTKLIVSAEAKGGCKLTLKPKSP